MTLSLKNLRLPLKVVREVLKTLISKCYNENDSKPRCDAPNERVISVRTIHSLTLHCF